jgi:predicted transcriptional regulator of viral defense system
MSQIMDELISIAADQHGLVATWQASEVGIHSQRLNQLASRGRLERITQGIYRVSSLPIDEYSALVEAVLWSKDGAITGESALLLWDLCDVNPRKIHLAVASKPKREIPKNYSLHQIRLTPQDFDQIHNVATTSLPIAFRIAIAGGTPGNLIKQGVDKAEAMELFGDVTATKIKAQLYERDETA